MVLKRDRKLKEGNKKAARVTPNSFPIAVRAGTVMRVAFTGTVLD